jgi:hypothetical protein
MPDYQNGKIYKLVWSETNKIYIGSTCQKLSGRKADHIKSFKQYQRGKRDKTSSFTLIEQFGFDFKIILLEDFPCQRKEQLVAREQYYINKYRDIIINKNKAKSSKRREIRPRKYYNCKCGGKTDTTHIRDHIKTDIHIKWVNIPEIEFIE